MNRSDRFYWCTGCGKWHDPDKGREIHFSMYCEWEHPSPRNFEGTADELKRFLIAMKLRREDEEQFERRVELRLKIEEAPVCRFAPGGGGGPMGQMMRAYIKAQKEEK